MFDTAMMLGMEPYLPAPVVLGAILVFRLYYYIIPLFLAGSMFAGNEVLLRGGALLKSGFIARKALSIGRMSEPDFAVGVATGAVALCGALLLSIGVLDDRPDFSWIDPDFADMAASAGQFVPSLIGAALMVLAVGLSQRVTLAWGATIALLLMAAGYTAAQGDQLWIAAVLVLSAVLVAPFRDAFYRHARLLTATLQVDVLVPLIALAVCVFALAAFEPQVRRLSENSWWEIVLSPDLPNSLRMIMALAVLLALLAIWRLLRPGHVTWLPWAGEGRLRYASLGAEPPAAADGVVMGEAGRSAIPFLRLSGVMLGLGDPAGAPSDRISAIWRLRDLAAQEGLDPAVYRAGPGLLKVYGDLGLTALPLGPDGQLLPESEEDAAPLHHLPVLRRGARPGEAHAAAPRTRHRAGTGSRRRVSRLYHRVAPQDQQRTRHFLDGLAMLVARRGFKDHEAAVWLGAGCAEVDHLAHGVQRVPGANRGRPGDVVDPHAQAAPAHAAQGAFQHQPHGERGGVPAAGGQPAEHGAGRRVLVHVLRLEVELCGERLDPCRIDRPRRRGEHLPDRELLETRHTWH